MTEREEQALARLQKEIDKIASKENRILFFVLDTKGNPSGSLEYIYNLALILKEDGYDVTMLHQEEEFIGVEGWLGKKYAELPHANISKSNIDVSPADILFIPEIFAQVMNQTKKLPCKRIAILQNYDYLLEQMPFAGQWGDFGILEAVVNEPYNANLVKDIFPYVKTHLVRPFINPIFGETNEPKKMVVNIVAKNQGDINKIVKPFYWKYPAYKWVSFRDLRGFPKEGFAAALREAAITIWVDEDASFGYSALEAMRSGNILIAKMPKNPISWSTEDENSTKLKDCCIWFDDFNALHKQIASAVRSWTTDSVPAAIYEAEKETAAAYTYEQTKEDILKYVADVLETRKKEMEAIKVQVLSKNNEEKEEKA